MSRNLTSAAQAASLAPHVIPVALVELNFASGFVRVNSSSVAVPWNSYAWDGVGLLGGIDPIAEMPTPQGNELALTLSGVRTSLVATARDEDYQGRECRIWLAFLNADYSVIADPYLLNVYSMDTMSAELGETATLTLTVQSQFADWNRPRIRRYNDADQQAEFPGDRGCEYMEQLVEKTLTWGKPGGALPAVGQSGAANTGTNLSGRGGNTGGNATGINLSPGSNSGRPAGIGIGR